MSHVTVKLKIFTPRLFLASVASKSLDKIANLLPNKPKNEIRVAFIPTAADPYKDKQFVKEDRDKLEEMGFEIFDLDIKDKTERQLEEELRNINIIFISGGNTFYLLDKARQSGFDQLVKDLVLGKGVLYIGSSAGAALAGPDIKPIELLDDPSSAPDLKSTKGLDLVNFVVLPHYGDKKYEEKFQKIIKEYENKYELIPLTNEQAVIVEGSNYSIV